MDENMRKTGFTLAELLIIVAILGIIATFAVPKVLQSQQANKKKAVLQETLSALASITIQGWQKGELKSGRNGLYILEHLNVAKLCETDADAQGCWTFDHAMPNMEQMEPGAIMHNGATLGGFNDQGGTYNWVFVDWNGPEPPNVEGEDQLKLLICYETNGNNCGWSENRSGTIRPLMGFESEALYREVFSH